MSDKCNNHMMSERNALNRVRGQPTHADAVRGRHKVDPPRRFHKQASRTMTSSRSVTTIFSVLLFLLLNLVIPADANLLQVCFSNHNVLQCMSIPLVFLLLPASTGSSGLSGFSRQSSLSRGVQVRPHPLFLRLRRSHLHVQV